MPSTKRAAAVEQYGERAEEDLQEQDDGWVATPNNQGSNDTAEEIPSIESSGKASQSAQPAAEGGSDDDIPDIDDLVLDDDDAEVSFLEG